MADPPTPPVAGATLAPPPLPARRSASAASPVAGSSSLPSSPPPPAPKPSAPPLPGRNLPPALPTRPSLKLASPLAAAGGLEVEQLNVLLRRFDKQILHVHSIPATEVRISSAPPLLDLQPAPKEAFSPEKLRSNAERLYSTVLVGLIRFGQEIARLRSWNETGRSSLFLGAYVAAWSAHLVWASTLSFLSVLVLVPASRSVFFPAAAPSDAPSTPADGQGAETVERDAAVFVDGLEGLAQASFQNHAGAAELSLDEYEAELHIADDDDDLGDELDGPARKRKAKKDKRDRKDRKKQERDEMMRKIGTPAMQIAGDLADGWERWANALSPTPPFSGHASRVSIFLSILLPIIVSSALFSDFVFSKVTSAFVGFLFFGGPVLDRLVLFLNVKIPGWQEKMELRNGILAGCPTDAQLTLRLLRDAEARLQPLAPPPPAPVLESPVDDSSSIAESTFSDVTSALSEATLEDADGKKKAKSKGGFGVKLAGAVRTAAKLTEDSAAILGGHKQVDWGSVVTTTLSRMNVPVPATKAAKTLLGFIPTKDEKEGGPSSYFVYHAGRPGHLLIHPFNSKTQTAPSITFTTVEDPSLQSLIDGDSGGGAGDKASEKKKKVRAVIPVSDITGLRKNGLGGWQGRMLVNLAVSGFQGVGGAGLEIKVRRSSPATASGLEGEREGEGAAAAAAADEVAYAFGGIMRRDELFARLVALGDQRWECL